MYWWHYSMFLTANVRFLDIIASLWQFSSMPNSATCTLHYGVFLPALAVSCSVARFWKCSRFLTSWRISETMVAFDQLDVFLTDCRVFHCMLCFWQNGVFLSAWCVSDRMSCFSQHGVFLTEWRVSNCMLCFWQNGVFLTACCVSDRMACF